MDNYQNQVPQSSYVYDDSSATRKNDWQAHANEMRY